MINLNTLQKLPKSLKWYYLAKLALPFVLIYLLLIYIRRADIALMLVVPLLPYFLSPPIVLLWAYLLLYNKSVSFVVENEKITINSGIIIKKSKTINFDRIQNIVNTKGPLSILFGISKLSLWTASPTQIQVKQGKSESNPDGFLWLKVADAEALKEFISKKRL